MMCQLAVHLTLVVFLEHGIDIWHTDVAVEMNHVAAMMLMCMTIVMLVIQMTIVMLV
jgi:hypothetical protein